MAELRYWWTFRLSRVKLQRAVEC